MVASLGRREFIRLLSVGGVGALSALRAQRAVGSNSGTGGASNQEPVWNRLRRAPEAAPENLTLLAEEGLAEIGGGVRASAWMLNDSLPSPVLRVRRGDRFQVTLRNELPDDLILHWHGLTPPEHSDGHPRFAVPKGGTYDYEFVVEDRAGTYWYHSHTHGRTARHTALGIGGMLIVEDEGEEALGLPSGEREIALILQDRQLDGAGLPVHTYGNVMAGYLGSEVFCNGIRRAYVDCATALYRFRILNGSNARIFRVERSDRRPLVLIGNDGGLLESPSELEFVDIAPAERVDLLVDLSRNRVGEDVYLRSRAFRIPGGLEHVLQGTEAQGAPMDLLRLRVSRATRDSASIPDRFALVPAPDPAESVRERTFHFGTELDENSQTMLLHRINDRSFEIDRIDERVPFGQTEIWSFVNDDRFAHPIHLHAAHFRVLSRTGGRGTVFPWEDGLKDTVSLFPSERVRVAVQFTAYRGLFLLHCHNLEHEDTGMMFNILVE